MHRLALVGMDGLHKGSRKLVGRHPEKVEKAFVGVLKFPHRIADRDHSGNAVDELAELTFTLTERLLRAFSLIDIRLQDAPTHDAALRVPNREPLHVEPPVSAIRAPLPMFIGERLAALD